MKKIPLLLLAIVGMISCSSPAGKYEKAIAGYVQTDRGVKTDANFKAVEIEEVGRVSVVDSVKILTDAFNAERDKTLAGLQQTVDRNAANIEKEKNSRVPSQATIKFYQEHLDVAQGRIDALRAAVPPGIDKYEGMNDADILAVIVRCTYTVDEPFTGERATETFDFYLSPDGTKCYTQKSVKQ